MHIQRRTCTSFSFHFVIFVTASPSPPLPVRTDTGLLSDASSPFAAAVSSLMKGSVDVLTDAAQQLPPLLGYPLSDTAASEEFKPVSERARLLLCGRTV